MRRLALIAAATAAFVAGSAWAARAEGVPRYDPADYCRTVADTVGGSDMIRNGCIQQEQEAYDSLKADWAGIPAKNAAWCDEVARSVGGSYQILHGCIQQEVEAASDPTEFEF